MISCWTPLSAPEATIIAAEKVGRRGYGVEIEPRYVDVSIRRWEAFTKSEAILEGDGRTFAEVEAERLLEERHHMSMLDPMR